nr:unnamed protein product [Callosobruchus chinensis]
MASVCTTCIKTISPQQPSVSCSSCLKLFHGSCVNLSTNDINFLSEKLQKWLCPLCSKQGRITRSNSSSSARTDLACPVPADLPPSASNLAAIMEQLSNIARDVRDIKESQSRLSNDITQCKSLLQQHSSIIGQHETSLRVCENNIADIQNFQTEVSRNLEAIGNRVTALELNVGLGTTPQADRARPVKVCFATPAVARTVLRKKNQLRGNTTYDSIKITDDKTPAQLNELSNLRVELRRRQESGEPYLTIKYGDSPIDSASDESDHSPGHQP